MELFELFAARRSVRAFETREVEEGKLSRILEAVNSAPSAGNLQGYGVVVVRDPEARARLAKAAGGQGFLTQAPVVLVFCADARRSGERYGPRGEGLYCVQDATIACTYAMLAARDLGLATVWVGAFFDDAVSEVIGIAPPLRPVAMLPIGYPAEAPSPRPRRPLGELTHQERW
ncbi:MAG TPA: nitroreductase family protein [Armatimonadota bacterium]|jgi:nitroreductase